MAIASAVGLLLLAGYGMTSVAYSMPFIVFSVGVDNVFILLSAWRSTSSTETFEHRMEETFADAAVSITVTSLTDLISFGVGCATPFPSVQMFCAYAVAAVIFTYIYQLTFFAAVMVYTNRREVNNRHCITFHKLKRETLPEKVAAKGDRSFEKNSILAQFFRTSYSDFLLNPLVRIFILTTFCVYLAVASYGCTKVKLGLEPNDLLPENSYGKRTLMMAEKYFSDYGSSLHVWMYNLSEVNVAPRKIWNVLEKEIELYEHTEFTSGSDSWLRTFLAFVKQAGLLITPENFVYILKNVFLSQPQFAKYNRDVVLTMDGEHLEASRIPVQLRHVGSANQSRAMRLFRRLAETSELQTGVYADFFQFAEQYNAVLPGTLSSIAYAGVAVVAVSLILIPEPVASLWVSFSIVSINIGILGFMTFWSVRLDFISMVTIVMSIGFCVDFAAHLAYNFAKGENIDAPERMRNALYAVGAPILMSASSTIIGVSFMASAESYVFRSFLKTIILVILLGALHGLVILPVLLSMFYCGQSSKATKEHMDAVDQKLQAQYNNPASRTASIQFLSNPDLYTMPPPPPNVEYSLSTLEFNRTQTRPLGAPPLITGSPKRELSGLSGPPEYEEHDPSGLSTFGVAPAVVANTTGMIPMRAKLKYPTNMTTSAQQRRENESRTTPELYYPS
uniref:SSD domain-containing protein n=1 Tax=Caenorhabditis tropicalis TaxID=1561998 RepID=A0A1I7TM67_9PELO